VRFEILETEGGKLFVALVMLSAFLVIAFVLHISGHDPAETGRTLISDAIATLLGVVIGKITARSPAPQNPPGQGGAERPTKAE